jgi:hypothetical protein
LLSVVKETLPIARAWMPPGLRRILVPNGLFRPASEPRGSPATHREPIQGPSWRGFSTRGAGGLTVGESLITATLARPRPPAGGVRGSRRDQCARGFCLPKCTGPREQAPGPLAAVRRTRAFTNGYAKRQRGNVLQRDAMTPR